MDTISIRPALDFGKVCRLKDRLEAGNLMTAEERKAFHRILMFYGEHAVKALE